MTGAATTPRFCSMCGTRLTPGHRFCSACGAEIRPGVAGAFPAAAVPGTWRLTSAGLGLAGFLVVSGLAIWAAILSPEPPRPGPGGMPRTALAPEGAAAVAGPIELPAEVKTFITELAARAKASPDDLPTWARLGAVYYRAAQLDPAYYPEALRAFDHVLAREPDNLEAVKGKANVFYDRNDHAQAIPLYERVLAATPDDPDVLTDLATMRLSAGDAKQAIDGYEAVIAKHPEFLQAHYNLAVTHAQLGHTQMALERFRAARAFAPDEGTRKQIDAMMARLTGAVGAGAGGGPTPGADSGQAGARTGGAPAAAPPVDATPRSPFQAAVEKAFRSAPIMGERIVRFEWSGPGTARALVQDFPMDAMPPAVRDKFATRLAEDVRAAAGANAPGGPVTIEIADAAAGTVMTTVSP